MREPEEHPIACTCGACSERRRDREAQITRYPAPPPDPDDDLESDGRPIKELVAGLMVVGSLALALIAKCT